VRQRKEQRGMHLEDKINHLSSKNKKRVSGTCIDEKMNLRRATSTEET
jgi:hypothetical protein